MAARDRDGSVRVEAAGQALHGARQVPGIVELHNVLAGADVVLQHTGDLSELRAELPHLVRADGWSLKPNQKRGTVARVGNLERQTEAETGASGGDLRPGLHSVDGALELEEREKQQTVRSERITSSRQGTDVLHRHRRASQLTSQHEDLSMENGRTLSVSTICWTSMGSSLLALCSTTWREAKLVLMALKSVRSMELELPGLSGSCDWSGCMEDDVA